MSDGQAAESRAEAARETTRDAVLAERPQDGEAEAAPPLHKASDAVQLESRAATAGPASDGSPSTSSDGDDDEEEGDEEGSISSSESDEVFASVLDRMKRMLHLQEQPGAGPPPVRPPVLPSLDLAGVAAYIKQGKAKNIICMCGAGVSCSAGIPDFRTPGTGLYSRLEEYNLPHPQAIFELDFFKRNPMPFYTLARELYPGNFEPTPTHRFMRQLAARGLLKRCYTQNIDSLEVAAGLPRDLVVAAHGNFDSASCVRCGKSHDPGFVRASLFPEGGAARQAHAAEAPREAEELAAKLSRAAGAAGSQPGAKAPISPPRCDCGGLVKPDIVMFGENLPDRFWQNLAADFAAADLLIVLGTSLVVQPFASLIDRVRGEVPRLLINRERVGEADAALRAMGWDEGFDFPPNPTAWRDAFFQGDCDSAVAELEAALGWGSGSGA